MTPPGDSQPQNLQVLHKVVFRADLEGRPRRKHSHTTRKQVRSDQWAATSSASTATHVKGYFWIRPPGASTATNEFDDGVRGVFIIAKSRQFVAHESPLRDASTDYQEHAHRLPEMGRLTGPWLTFGTKQRRCHSSCKRCASVAFARSASQLKSSSPYIGPRRWPTA